MNRLRDRLAAAFAPDSPGRRLLLLVLVALACAALLTPARTLPDTWWEEGQVADQDVVAPVDFRWRDAEATARARAEAEAAVPPVWQDDLAYGRRVENRIAQAFDMGRRRAATEGGEAERAALLDDVRVTLDLPLTEGELRAIAADGWSVELEDLAIELVGVALRRPILADRSALPSPPRPIAVVQRLGAEEEEVLLDDWSALRVPEEARQAVTLHVVERLQKARDPDRVALAAAIARASVRPTLTPAPGVTQARREAARAAIPEVEHQVHKGTRVVRAGDVVTAAQRQMLEAMARAAGPAGGPYLFGTWAAFAAALVGAAVTFAQATMRKFARRTVELEAMGAALVAVLAIARLLTEVGARVPLPGSADLTVLALLAPVGGGAMLVRTLVNSESALVWSLAAALLAAAMMDQSVLLAAYYLVTALAAAGGVGKARERVVMLRAGVQGGLVGAGLVLLVVLVRSQSPTAEVAIPDANGVLLLAGTALAAGIANGAFALATIPVFELRGFVTDYKLLELANLNHPLLRQLMLRAPGTYHHSVIVGSLSEAACEAIGANALLARVACYFHDIGKGLKPQYFVENQRDEPSRHERLSPAQSAAVIINHVRDGGQLARQYGLPKPITDQIYMHHGTGLIQYFYAKAREQAGEGETVDEALFRYPGPKPDTREAGVIMLADKVEAACRTIREPSEARIRAMIQQITNSVMVDGQFENCPLTLRELYVIADAFTNVLLGIYHHRIEYPSTAGIASGKGRYVPVPKQGTITLEIVNPLSPPPRPGAGPRGMPDYESADQLPGVRPSTLPPPMDES